MYLIFLDGSKNFGINIEKKISLDHKIIIILSIMSNAVQIFDIPVTNLNIQHNYFDYLTKLFLDLYFIAEFLNTSAKLSFSSRYLITKFFLYNR